MVSLGPVFGLGFCVFFRTRDPDEDELRLPPAEDSQLLVTGNPPTDESKEKSGLNEDVIQVKQNLY